MKPLTFINRFTGKKEVEKVYGGSLIRWQYQSPLGLLFSYFIKQPMVSKLYGLYQDCPLSKTKIAPFIENFSIAHQEYLPAEGRSDSDPYANFNEFFTRKFRPGMRPFAQGNPFPAPCEARYLVFDCIHDHTLFPVKGQHLSYKKLLQNEKWASVFAGGPLFIARLCPVDYHRFHFPDDGNYLDFYPIKGDLHSVNPIALKAKGDIFITNERHVSILELKSFGKMAFIEVGATCVGKIKQTHPLDRPFKRGDEKGMFLFGGSTVIGIGQAGRWSFDHDLIKNTEREIETYIKLGSGMGGPSPR